MSGAAPLALALLLIAAPAGASDLEDAIRAALEGAPGQSAVAFRDLRTGEEAAVNAAQPAHAASLMKVPVMLSVFDAIERGELALDQPVRVRRTFRSLFDGSAFTMEVGPDTPVAVREGESVPLEELVG